MVIFDLAGTTVDYGSLAPARAFIELFSRHQISVTDEQARGPMGMHKKEHIRLLSRIPQVAEQWTAVYQRECKEEDVDELYREFIPLQMEILPRFSKLIPGTLEVIEQLRNEGIAVAATTGYSREMTAVVLEEAARQGFEPDIAICGEDVPQGRPAPWMAFTCAMRLGIYPPSTIIKVGDTIVDIEAGINAGMWSFGVTRTGNMLGLSRDEDLALSKLELSMRLEKAERQMRDAGADMVLESIIELPGAIEEIEEKMIEIGRD